MKKGIILQARNSSSRFPEKMIYSLCEKPVINWVIDRTAKADVDFRILATSREKSDDKLAEIAASAGWQVVRGDLVNVLSRYEKAVLSFGLDLVVRITGDCVLIDFRLINEAIRRFIDEKADYLILTGIIDGFDVEVMSGAAILEAAKKAKLPAEIEHVTPYIRQNMKSVRSPYGNEDLSGIHLSIDYPVDAEVLSFILQQLDDGFTYEDVVSLIRNNPAVLEKNKHIEVNCGMKITREEDKKYIAGRKAKPLNLSNSMKHFEQTLKIIPNGSQTFSKSHLQFSVGVSPLFVKEGKGCILEDIDGNRFIDYTMGLGPGILGYAFEPINDAVMKQLQKGMGFTLSHELEYELANILCSIIPSAEMVRFGKNGSDVTSAAVRIARAFTGRDYVACCGYHGWQDWYIATTSMNKGIPENVKKLTLSFDYNDIASLEKLFIEHKNQIACIIMEPVSLKAPDNDFLQRVRQLASDNGTVLVFDEIVTGFRLALGGAQEFFGVTPDISCFGKAMANGMPISAIAGRKDIMKLFEETFFSFTFGGETLSIAAAIATIKYLQENKVIDYLWGQGEKLKNGIDRLIREKKMEHIIEMAGYPVRTVMTFKKDDDLKIKTLFQQESVKRGVLFTSMHNISLPHNDGIIDDTLSVYDEVMDIVKYSLEYDMVDEMLEGKILKPVFRKV